MARNPLLSPGAATAERAQVELDVTAVLLARLEEFLEGVRDDASRALDSPVLLAAGGRTRLTQPRPFTLGSVQRRWVRMLADAEAADPRLTGMADRLRNDRMPDQVFESARSTLTTGQRNGWSSARTRRELRTALSPRTATAQEESTPPDEPDALVTRGQSWEATMRMIARHEATIAYNTGALAGLGDIGAATKKWVAHHDRFVRPSHAAASGQVVPVNEPFIVGGEALMYPGDPAGSMKQTANCRCVLVNGDPPAEIKPPGPNVTDLFDTIDKLPPARSFDDGYAAQEKLRKMGGDHVELADFASKWTGPTNVITEVRRDMEAGGYSVVRQMMADGKKAPPLYRSISQSTAAGRAQLESLTVGDTVDLRGASSFTESENWALEFVGGLSNVLFKVENARGIPMAKLSNSPHELEWVLGGKLEVTDVIDAGDSDYGVIEIEATWRP